MRPYRCAGCGADGCKLWREYQTFAPKLLCANCAASDQGMDVTDIDADGLRAGGCYETRTDQIGWYVPAVPVDDTFWGYTSIPDDGIAWWKALPTLAAPGEDA
jgi:hypothetical protein